MKNWFFIFKINLIFIFSFLSIIYAGETGKIAGIVLDKQTGQPLVGANIVVESILIDGKENKLDYPMGASTDLEGVYFIINIRPGLYNVRASYVGYNDEVTTKVQINIDKSTILDYNLSEKLEETEEIVVTAYAPTSVEKDLTATKQVYNVAEVQGIAGVADISDILELQADVVDDHFRGGRVGESSYLVGGAAIVNPLNNQRAFSPIVTGLEQVEVYTSGFSAEYGNAQSGVVNMVTKEGTNQWNSRAEFSATLPYYKTWEGSVYSPENLDFYDLLIDTEEWLKENPLNPGLPLWDRGYGVTKYLPPRNVWPPDPLNHQDSLKIAELGRMLWLLSVRDVGLEYDNTMDYRADFTTGGPIADNAQLFLAVRQNLINPIIPTPTPNLERQLMANITYSPNTENKYKFSFIFDNTFDNYLNSNWERWLFDRTLSVTKRTQNSTHYGVEWKHIFSLSSFADINFKVLNVLEQDRIDLLEEDQFLDDYSSNRNWVDYTGPSNHRVGRVSDDRGDKKTTTYFLNGSYSNQIDRYNFLKSGLQFYYYDVHVNYENNATNAGNVQKLIFNVFPYEGALYFQNKMEYEALVANLGLRLDFYHLNTKYFIDKFYPLRDPNLTKRTKLFTKLQPRLGISFPISETTVFHLNYGTFTQRPNFNQLFYNEINDDGGAVSIIRLGNPQLKPEDTKTYDLGIQQNLAMGLKLDVSAYYKDVKNLVQLAFYKTEGGESYQTYVNKDYADIKGFHVSLEKTYGDLRGYLRYNYESATGKSGNPDNLDVPFTYYNYTPSEDEIAANPRFPEDVYLDYDRTHKIVFNLRYITPKDAGPEVLGIKPLADLSISNTFRYYSGRPFTLPPSLDKFGQALKFNERTPREREWRIRIEKGLDWGKTNITAYMEIFNVLNEEYWHYSRTFNDETNTIRWYTDREDILTDKEFSPYVTSQDLYLLRNQPRHYRIGLIFKF